MLKVKRIYEESRASDGTRVLVDRLWPRGVSKDSAALDMWLKEIAPSNELRTWFDHRPERFAEFREKYMTELSNNPAVSVLKALEANVPDITLLYAAKDTSFNHAVVLREFLEKHTSRLWKE